MKTAIKVLLVLSCVVLGLYIIPLAWTIPMTVIIWQRLNRNEKVGIAMSVCTLLFINMIAGILLLVDDDSNAHYEIGESKSKKLKKDDNLEMIKLYKELYDFGAITEEEFNEKKRQLLDL